MKILNVGSLNIDYVYRVDHIVRPGETIGNLSRSVFAGGKGANQSVALAHADAEVYHAGKVGRDGAWLLELLAQNKVDVTHTVIDDRVDTGHAMIQVDAEGQNSIVLHGGANHSLSEPDIAAVFAGDFAGDFAAGDILLLQNETNLIESIMRHGHEIGMKVCFNPAPFSPEIADYPLDCVDLFIVNETEGLELSGCKPGTDTATIVSELKKRFPQAEILMTLGAAGVLFSGQDDEIQLPACPADVVDTTAAGDTFIGYYLASISKGATPLDALTCASAASAITVSRAGAMNSIPLLAEVQ
jgi:ribokinase